MRNLPYDIGSLPEAMAHCALRRALRSVIDRDVAFVACIVVDDPERLSTYELAAERLFLRRDLRGIRMAQDKTSVCAFSDSTALLTRMHGDATIYNRNVFLFASEDLIPTHFRLACEFLIKLAPPDAGLVTSAIKLIRGEVIGKEIADIIARADWKDLRILFRDGKSIRQSADRLAQAKKMRMSNADIDEAARRQSQAKALRDLEGYGDATAWGKQMVADLTKFRAGALPWSEIERGILLYGPPGTGKTRFARLLAEACDVPLVSGSYARWQSHGHQGDALKAMRETFKTASAYEASILLIDELDNFRNRDLESDTGDYLRGVTNGLLECLDGVERRVGTVVVATTNRIDVIDEAVIRPGRIDTHIRIDPPGADDRCLILERYLDWTIPTDFREEIAMATEGDTGASLERLARVIRRWARDSGTKVGMEAIRACLPKISFIPEGRVRASALHEAGHAVVGLTLGRELMELRLAHRYLEDRGEYQLGVCRFTEIPFHGRGPSFLLDEIKITLGGMASETEFFGAHSDGCGGHQNSDLVRATNYATSYEAVYGMGQSLVSEPFKGNGQLARLRQFNPAIWSRVDALLKQAFEETRTIIRENKDFVSALADSLAEARNLSAEDVARLQLDHAFRFREDKPQSRAG
ncbi:AAA family ATPase [Rhizobium sp. FKL33]|uniref:AAA family ATPase n=1 Tax=Rhizobium sp. FKL33 TaxID=2562307 RepID=UPI0010C10079|nr:AAA family ATPase [Rhizobium sp. FKL33]